MPWESSAFTQRRVSNFETVTELLLASAIVSLSVALALTVIFLVVIYWLLEGRPSLGLANTVPIVSTMAVLGIPFNALTATILSITIGIGIDYSVRVTHRFIDEYNAGCDAHTALVRTLRGTGGGITGSMSTSVSPADGRYSGRRRPACRTRRAPRRALPGVPPHGR